jgi:hypothetical protein
MRRRFLVIPAMACIFFSAPKATSRMEGLGFRV